MFHNFWAAAPDHQQEQMAHFLKNLAIMGGLLMIVAHGPGPLSITQGRRRI
jgi:putative oxidoreductase